MSKQPQKVSLNLNFVIPADLVVNTANENLDSDDENIRTVSKAILDLTREATKVKDGMATNGNVDLAPYFDFWFADAIAAANTLLKYDDANIRYMAECLIEQEKAIHKSKTSFLEEMKRLGIKPKY